MLAKGVDLCLHPGSASRTNRVSVIGDHGQASKLLTQDGGVCRYCVLDFPHVIVQMAVVKREGVHVASE